MKIQASLLLSTLVWSAGASAQTAAAPKAPEPDYTLAFNAGIVSDYRYRGISQSRLLPAAQAGADIAHKSGLYLGAWGSSIRWIKDNSTAGQPIKGPVELDIYGGYKFSLGDVGVDLGALRYQYVGNDLQKNPAFVNANTTELYAAATVQMVTLKYSQSTTALFGTPNSKGSQYLDLSATIDLGSGLTLTPHVGHQLVKNSSPYDYTDYSVTLAKDLGNGLAVSLMAVGTTADTTLYTWGGKEVGKAGAVLGLKYTF